jgi:hypothetical protein
MTTRTFTASGAIAGRRFVKFGATDKQVVQASAATDAIIGVTEKLGAADGAPIDVILNGPADVEFAGIVARGGFVTSDADGKGVACAPAAGSKARSGGQTLVTTAAGDFGEIMVNPSVVTEPV